MDESQKELNNPGASPEEAENIAKAIAGEGEISNVTVIQRNTSKNNRVKWFPKFEDSIGDQSKKIVVITGTTTGTGFIATQTALKKGARVICLNRNNEKAQKALESFFESHEGAEERCSFVLCDLQDFESVTNAAEELKKMLNETGFDVLVNNAGVMALADKATKDGYDVQMQTNHLSHFLLTSLLFPLLKQRSEECGEARVVNHSSVLRLYPAIPLKAKYFRKNGGKLGGNGRNWVTGARWKRYHQTKLANSVFTVALAKRIKAANLNIISLCAHPGVATTELGKTAQKDGAFSKLGYERQAQSQEDGTMGILKCMFHTDVKQGGMYGPRGVKGRPKKITHGVLTSSAAGKLLWKESESACGPFEVK